MEPEGFSCRHCDRYITASKVLRKCPHCREPICYIPPDYVLGNYQILDPIGDGAMGQIFKAKDLQNTKIVALKILSTDFSEDDESLKRFKNEIELLRKLSHPNIVTAYDSGQIGDIHYYAMDYVKGQNLDEIVEEEGVMTESTVLTIAQKVSLALAHAWNSNNMIHRDIKPSNIMLGDDGDIKVTDFGISKNVVDNIGITKEGRICGSPDFMSPEQIQGKNYIDYKTDIYALGATMYFILTNEYPFDAETPIKIMVRHVEDDIPQIKERNPSISEETNELVFRMMSKDPDDRPDTWESLAQEIGDIKNGRARTTKLKPGGNKTKDSSLLIVIPVIVVLTIIILILIAKFI